MAEENAASASAQVQPEKDQQSQTGPGGVGPETKESQEATNQQEYPEPNVPGWTPSWMDNGMPTPPLWPFLVPPEFLWLFNRYYVQVPIPDPPFRYGQRLAETGEEPVPQPGAEEPQPEVIVQPDHTGQRPVAHQENENKDWEDVNKEWWGEHTNGAMTWQSWENSNWEGNYDYNQMNQNSWNATDESQGYGNQHQEQGSRDQQEHGGHQYDYSWSSNQHQVDGPLGSGGAAECSSDDAACQKNVPQPKEMPKPRRPKSPPGPPPPHVLAHQIAQGCISAVSVVMKKIGKKTNAEL